ncbi:DUF4407 domain-containing protein [Actinoplanes sp. NPDC049265]|uniref:DUF4407 domain-containing protein n=1 Tax=Actinoplanes sp. NPDC049265 TaxID=3363902 RepID=UPI003713B126
MRGQFLRRLAGVQEPVLDLVPGERARCTSLGGVVLTTATLAAVSMLVALSTVFGSYAHPVVILLAAGWGLAVLNLDRWLVSAVVTSGGLTRLLRFLPRLALAVMFGFLIAEPLLLGVFNSAVESEVRNGWAQERQTYEDDLVRCNPDGGPAARPAGCPAGRSLSLSGSPAATRTLLTGLSGKADALERKIVPRQREYGRLKKEAADNCAGVGSAAYGYGTVCRQLNDRAEKYRAVNRLDANQHQLDELRARVEALLEKEGAERAGYAEKRDKRIHELVGQMEQNQRVVGLAERLRAMSDLVGRNSYVHTVQWALRIFFVAMDALPVLVKWIGGVTAYDRVAGARLARQEHDQRLAEGTISHQAAMTASTERYQIDLEAAARREWAGRAYERSHDPADRTAPTRPWAVVSPPPAGDEPPRTTTGRRDAPTDGFRSPTAAAG